MQSAAEVISKHQIQGPKSCISWTIEFILKLHEKIPLNEHPIQTAYPDSSLGFSDVARNILDAHEIHSWENSLEISEFEKASKEDAALGYPLVFSIPTGFSVDIFTPRFH